MSYNVRGKNSSASIVRDKENPDMLYVKLKLSAPHRFNTLYYQSSAPYDKRQSFAGSGLPFPNPETAYSQHNINQGSVSIQNNSASFVLKRPNSYYINAGTTLVPPHIYIKFGDENLDDVFDDILMIPYIIPYRSLTHHHTRTSVDFYDQQPLPERSQQQILKDCSYPSKLFSLNELDNFWNQRPRR